MDEDPAKEISINVDLLDRAVKAIQALCPNFQFIILPTGTKVNFSSILAQNINLELSDLWGSSARQIPFHSTSR